MNDILLLIPNYFCSMKDISNFLTTNNYLYTFLYKYAYMEKILQQCMENNEYFYKKMHHSKFMLNYHNLKNVNEVLKNYNYIVSIIPHFSKCNTACFGNIEYYTGYTLAKFLDDTQNQLSLTNEHYAYIYTVKKLLKYKFGWKLFINKYKDEKIKLSYAEYQHYIYIIYYDLSIKNGGINETKK